MLFFNHTPPTLILPEIFLSVLVFLGEKIFFSPKICFDTLGSFWEALVLVHTLGGGGKKSVD